MSAQVISFARYWERSCDWTQRELAEFYRVESALTQAGLQLETERGVSDEGEPWFVFVRSDTGEVFIHFARIDGTYVAVGAALEQMVEGKDFATLVQEMLAAQAWIMAKARNRSNVFLHPSALLIAIVGGAFFHSGEAKAAETTTDHGRMELRRHVLPIMFSTPGEKATTVLDASETAAILSGMLSEWNRIAPLAAYAMDSLPSVAARSELAVAPAPPPDFSAPGVSAPPAGEHASDLLAPPSTIDLSSHIQSVSVSLGSDTAFSAVAPPTVERAVDMAAFDHLNSAAVPGGFALPLASSAFILGQLSTSQAGEIIQSSTVLADLTAQPALIAPSPALLGLVNQGDHVVLPVVSPPTPTPSAGPLSPVSADGPGAAAPPASPAPEAASIISPQVTAAVLHFSAEVSVLDVAVSGKEIILYDGAIFKALPPGTHLESMTFNFSDGSSISLVGTVAELQALHLT